MPSSLPPNDFGDWLSPIVVKEWRQASRTLTFMATFLGLQAAMALLLAAAAWVQRLDPEGEAPAFLDLWFWGTLSVTLLALTPWRGFWMVGPERKDGTMELMKLTRMGPTRIIHGKWLVLAAQSALFVIAILPYAVLRYFLGRVEIAQDLMIIGVMLASSFFLSSFTLALSAMGWKNSAIFLFLVGCGSPIWAAVTFALSWMPWVGPFVAAGFSTLVMLQIGAAFMEPIPYHSTPTGEANRFESWEERPP